MTLVNDQPVSSTNALAFPLDVPSVNVPPTTKPKDVVIVNEPPTNAS